MGANDHVKMKERISRCLPKEGEWSPNGELLIEDVADFPCLSQILRGEIGASEYGMGGRIGLFIQHGRLTACVNFPAMQVVAFVVLGSLRDALCDLEAKIDSEGVQWRPESKNGKKK